MTLSTGAEFAGTGGALLAELIASDRFDPAWAVELEGHGRAVLERRFAGLRLFEDVRDGRRRPRVDLVSAGFPCQPFSVAGRRTGDGDERNLWPETAAELERLRPRVALLENVPGLRMPLPDGSPSYLGRIFRDLVRLGYSCIWDGISAVGTGAWHRRDRLWIVAWRGPLGDFDPFRPERPRQLERYAEYPLIGRLVGENWGHPGDLFEPAVPISAWPRAGMIDLATAEARQLWPAFPVPALPLGTTIARLWPTATAADVKRLNGDPDKPERGGKWAVRLFPTPTEHDMEHPAHALPTAQRRSEVRALRLQDALADIRLFPTPVEGDATGGRTSKGRERPDDPGLRKTVERLWSTPTASPPGWKLEDVVDGDGNTPEHLNQRLYRRESGSMVTHHLEAEVRFTLWPTPRESEWKGTGPLGSPSHEHRRDRSYLDATVQEAIQSSGVLNPTWVETLMGYPRGWTDLDVEDVELRRDYPALWAHSYALPSGYARGAWDDGVSHLAPRTPTTTPRLRAMGNAWVPDAIVPVLRAIADHLG